MLAEFAPGTAGAIIKEREEPKSFQKDVERDQHAAACLHPVRELERGAKGVAEQLEERGYPGGELLCVIDKQSRLEIHACQAHGARHFRVACWQLWDNNSRGDGLRLRLLMDDSGNLYIQPKLNGQIVPLQEEQYMYLTLDGLAVAMDTVHRL